MKIKRVLTAVVVMASVGIGAYLVLTPSESKSKGPESSQETPANSKPRIPKPVSAIVHHEDAPQVKVPAEFKYLPALQRYQRLHKKVLMSKEERGERDDLLKDREFIRSLKPLLLVEASKENQSMQNTALDFLFEALQKPESHGEVVEVLMAVVADGAVENEASSMQTRQALAGLKAEVLLNWSSLDPAAEVYIQANLPGPVSEKIWNRVKAHQENNLAESATLQARK